MDRDTLTPGDLRALAALASSAAARAEQDMERCREEGRGADLARAADASDYYAILAARLRRLSGERT